MKVQMQELKEWESGITVDTMCAEMKKRLLEFGSVQMITLKMIGQALYQFLGCYSKIAAREIKPVIILKKYGLAIKEERDICTVISYG